MFAPIVYMNFNRPENTRASLQALAANEFASESDLIVYVDGHRTPEEKVVVDEVCALCESAAHVFRSFQLRRREQNLGCGPNFVQMFHEVFNEYETAIIIEDDIVLSPYALRYFNTGLAKYAENPAVFTVCGWSFPPQYMRFPTGMTHDAFFLHYPHMWGWATWRNRIQSIDWNFSDMEHLLGIPEERDTIKQRCPDLLHALQCIRNGQLSTWDYQVAYAALRQGRVHLLPRYPYCTNIGTTAGTHVSAQLPPHPTQAIDVTLAPKRPHLPDRIIVNTTIAEQHLQILTKSLPECEAMLHTERTSKVLHNVFATNFPRTILLSYVAEGVLALIDGAPLPRNHTAYAESVQIASICKDYGYNVDVCPYTYEGPIDYTHYDVIFGFGKSLVNAFYQNKRFVKTVFYGTGTAHTPHNAASAQKAKACYDEHGVWLLNSSRLVPDSHPSYEYLVSAIVSDAPHTYTNSSCPVYTMRMHYNSAVPESVLQDKDFLAAKSHFLYFGGGGSLHKGLDLALKAFSQRPDLTLHICDGLVPQFYEAFKEYFALPNIQYHGFLDVGSTDFQELMKLCGFTLCPSCSEGQPTAILNTSCNGLVAILSDGARPNAADDLAIRFSPLSVEGLLQGIDQATSLSDESLRDLSLATMARIREYHSMEAFDANMRRALGNVFALPVNPPPHPVSFTPVIRQGRLLTLCVVSDAQKLSPLREQLTALLPAVNHTLIGVSTTCIAEFRELDTGIYHMGTTDESRTWTLFDNVMSSLGNQWQQFDGILFIEEDTIAVQNIASVIAPLLHPLSHGNTVAYALHWLFIPPQAYAKIGNFSQKQENMPAVIVQALVEQAGYTTVG